MSASGAPDAGLLTPMGQVAQSRLTPQTGRHPLTGMIHLTGYGADPHAATDSTAAIQNALNDAADYAGSTWDSNGSTAPAVLVDGTFLCAGSLTCKTGVAMVGNGTDLSRIIGTAAAGLFVINGYSVVRGAWHDLTLHATTGPVFALSGTASTAMRDCRFERVRLWQASLAASIWSQTGAAQSINTTWNHVEFQMLAGATGNRPTVNPFYVSVSAGNVFNDNTFTNCTAIGRYQQGQFFHIECTNGGYLWNNTWNHVVGEYCQGGLFMLLGCGKFHITDCPDWDTTTPYDGDLYHFAASSGQSAFSYGLLERSHRFGTAGLAGGVFDIYAVCFAPSTAAGTGITIRDCDLGPTTPAAVNINGTVSWETRTKPYKLVTGTYTVNLSDPPVIVVNSASAATVTLPAVTSSANGAVWTIKNVGAGTVTVSPNVDGAAQTLTQWQKITVETDGLNAALGRIWWSI